MVAVLTGQQPAARPRGRARLSRTPGGTGAHRRRLAL